MPIRISPKVLQKLREKHDVEATEVAQCFENRTGGFLEDTREQHRTDPATRWFIALTNKNRLLKVAFIPRGPHQDVRTAFPPNAIELKIYRALGNPTDF